MSAEGGSDAFRAGRTNLRETAKWMVAGIVGAATLIVGSSTTSRLGAMDPGSARFWVAVIALIVAVGLCWIPFTRAVNVLRSELLSLQAFAEAEEGELKDAADAVSTIPGATPGTTLQDLARQYPALRSEAWSKAPDRDAATKAIAEVDERFNIFREACISALVAIRFDRLLAALKCLGAAILLSFLLFTWAANPATSAPQDLKLLDAPRAQVVSRAQAQELADAGIAAACSTPGTQLVAFAPAEGGALTAILVPPTGGPSSCYAHKITVLGNRILKVH